MKKYIILMIVVLFVVANHLNTKDKLSPLNFNLDVSLSSELESYIVPEKIVGVLKNHALTLKLTSLDDFSISSCANIRNPKGRNQAVVKINKTYWKNVLPKDRSEFLVTEVSDCVNNVAKNN